MTQAGLDPHEHYIASSPATTNAALLLLLLIASYVARAEELPPAPKGYFNDYAGVISEAKQHELNKRLAKFDKDTTNQVVVAIFPKMDSTLSLDEYTVRVANSWGVGRRGQNNGVTLFIFIRDRTMRIQVGYGLTSVFTDALSQQILDQDLKPHFQKGDFDGGLTGGVDSILKLVSGHQSPEPVGPK
jgi:uncharacterized protein